MDTKEIVEIVGEIVPAGETDLDQRHGPQALAVAQEMEAALASRLAEHPAYASVWQAFRAAPQQQTTVLVAVVQNLVQQDPTLAQQLDALWTKYQRLTQSISSTRINTGGGAYVGGSVSVEGGNFVGRDQTTVTGEGIVIGDHSSAVVEHGVDPAAVARAFRDLYAAVERKPDLPPEDKADLKEELQELEAEVIKGEAADEGFIARHLRNIKRMAPDILEIVVTTFINPVSGIGMVAKKVAERMREGMESA